MDITTLAAWGEFIGGIAVVVSLLYLASQVRQNSRLLQVSMTSSVADSDRMLSIEMVGHAEVALEVLLCIPSLLVPYDHDGIAVQSREPPDDCRVVAELPVSS